MVVRVISDKPIKTKKCTCTKCGYELEYTGEDVSFYNHTDYGGGSDTYYFIICPRETCKEKIFVSKY